MKYVMVVDAMIFRRLVFTTFFLENIGKTLQVRFSRFIVLTLLNRLENKFYYKSSTISFR